MPEPSPRPEGPALRLQGVVIRAGGRAVVDGADLQLGAGEIVGLVGPSGAGKSLLARAALGLVRARPGVVAGRLTLTETNTTWDLSRDRLDPLRGRVIGLLPQDGVGALNPHWTVRRHLRQLNTAPEGALAAAGFADPAQVLDLHPHRLSGGMAQRVCLALALGRGSRFILADEPMTGLDPSVRAHLLDRFAALRDRGIGVLLITHDLHVINHLVDRVVRMERGRIRPASTEPEPTGPHTPGVGAVRLRLRDIHHRYRRAARPALRGVSLTLRAGERVSVIGESGAGKTTLAQSGGGVLPPSAGALEVDGRDWWRLSSRQRRRRRGALQLVLQQASAHLDPSICLALQMTETATLHDRDANAIAPLLRALDLTARSDGRPGELSGGELRRAALGRALLVDPDILIADEPTAGLDAHRRADLLRRLHRPGRSVLIVSHDLRSAQAHTDRLIVLLGGVVMERLPADRAAVHPYTRALLAADGLGPGRPLSGPVPPTDTGCPFQRACPEASAACGAPPSELALTRDHHIACHQVGG